MMMISPEPPRAASHVALRQRAMCPVAPSKTHTRTTRTFTQTLLVQPKKPAHNRAASPQHLLFIKQQSMPPTSTPTQHSTAQHAVLCGSLTQAATRLLSCCVHTVRLCLLLIKVRRQGLCIRLTLSHCSSSSLLRCPTFFLCCCFSCCLSHSCRCRCLSCDGQSVFSVAWCMVAPPYKL